MKKKYGELIKKRREELGYSMNKLSLKSGVSESSICRFEAGKNIPSKKTLSRLEKALNIDFDLDNFKSKKLYLVVTQDKYSLPLAVADSAGELAEMCGVRKETVFERISAGKHLEYPKYIMVEIDESEDDDDEKRNGGSEQLPV